MFEKLCALIAEQFGVEPDSVTADTLEEEFGMEEMEAEEIESIVTVGDLHKYMQEHLDI